MPLGGAALAVLLALAGMMAAAQAADTCYVSINFQPPGDANVPGAWTAAGQAALGNANTDTLALAPLAAIPVPVLHVLADNPLMRIGDCVPASCLGPSARRRSLLATAAGVGSAATGWVLSHSRAALGAKPQCSLVTTPAAFTLQYSIGGKDYKTVGTFKDGTATVAPAIKLTEVASLPPGKHCMNVSVTLLAGTGKVTGTAALLPATSKTAMRTVCFNKIGAASASAPALAPEPEAPKVPKPSTSSPSAAAGSSGTSATLSSVGKDAKAGAAASPPARNASAPAPGGGDGGGSNSSSKPSSAVGIIIPMPSNMSLPIDDGASSALASAQYYCLRGFNIGGNVINSSSVLAGDAGVTDCSRACSAVKTCIAFGLVAPGKCYLLSSVNVTSAAAEAAVTGYCFKRLEDWKALGLAGAGDMAGTGFYCLAGYDIAGDGAASSDDSSGARASEGASKDQVVTASPAVCAASCLSLPSCQYFVSKRSACYLKANMLAGEYGTTGPSAEVVKTCVQGETNWQLVGAQLDYLLPAVPLSPLLDSNNITAGISGIGDGIGGVGGTGGGIGGGGIGGGIGATQGTYYCLRQWALSGTVVRGVQVTLGDAGTVTCAEQCDALGPAVCAAFATSTAGVCSLLGGVTVQNGTGDARINQMCVRSAAEFALVGNPDATGFYCLPKYDLAGDNVARADYRTITGGGKVAIDFCNARCAGTPGCQFVSTSLGVCYMRSNLDGGAAGTTGPSSTVDAVCVNGADAWMQLAYVVSGSPVNMSVPGIDPSAQPLARTPRQPVAGAGTLGGAAVRATALAAAALLLLLLL